MLWESCPGPAEAVVTWLVRMTQEAPDQLLMPLPAAKLTQSTMCRWVLSTDSVWYLLTLAPCRFTRRVKQTVDSLQ